MRGGGPTGLLAGSILERLARNHSQPAKLQAGSNSGPIDLAQYGRPLDDEAKKQREPPAQPTEPSPRTKASTGFYVSREGHIITNQHVAEDCNLLQTKDGTALKLIHSDKNIDL